MRMDSHIYSDYVVPPSYDSLLGKVGFGSKINRIPRDFLHLKMGSLISMHNSSLCGLRPDNEQ